ncbi:galactokinase, partial [bacterium]|nr:galactokinase [bacterium]
MSILDKNSITAVFQKIYGSDDGVIEKQKDRYEKLLASFSSHFGDKKPRVFSTPGRTEIGGNHTDHNHGRVLAGSVNLDSIAAATASTHKKVTVYSDGYPEPFVVDLENLSPCEDEKGTTTALIRGIAARLAELGYQIGGFNACLSSDILPGSGLSSSAS